MIHDKQNEFSVAIAVERRKLDEYSCDLHFPSVQQFFNLTRGFAQLTPVDQDMNALTKTVHDGDIKLLRRLIRSKAEINVQDADGFTPLLKAIELNNVECARVLLAGKAFIYSAGEDYILPLSQACVKGDILH